MKNETTTSNDKERINVTRKIANNFISNQQCYYKDKPCDSSPPLQFNINYCSLFNSYFECIHAKMCVSVCVCVEH